MKGASVQFAAPFDVDVVPAEVDVPGSGEVLVASRYSAISSGTEMLAYRGLLPQGLLLDESLAGMQEEATYPFKYGYALVGTVVRKGEDVDDAWLGRRVFAFHPHESHFVASTNALICLPDDLSFEDALFLANMETAVSFLMDGRPMIGERVLVIGLGVVGLLTASLLLRQQDLHVDVVDLKEKRRAWAKHIGVHEAYAPPELDLIIGQEANQYDLVYELSGNPAGLNAAIASAKASGKIVVGSWYGTKPAALDLGGRFHRSKLSIYASQVSTLDPAHAGRWTKSRRLSLALSLLPKLSPRRFISHQFSIEKAADAYQLLDQQNENSRLDEPLQVIFNYD
ncbi:MAG: zinc-binding dehydrogenase [Rhodothermales bacterium]